MVKAIIFDMDGTVIDSMMDDPHSILTYLEHLGVDTDNEEIKKVAELGWSITADDVNAVAGTDFCNKAFRDGFLETHYGKYENHYPLLPGFIDFIDHLDELGIKYAIATATRMKGAQFTFERLGIIDRFEFIITEGRVGKTKNFPHIYDEAARKMGADRTNTIVFEDAYYAVKTATDAGYRTVGIKEEYYKDYHDDIEKLVDVFVNDYEELMTLINNKEYKI